MQKLFLSVCCMVWLQFASAQHTFPSYPEMLQAFFSRYTVENNVEDELVFAKKKEGWYLQQVNRLQNDKLLKERIFWSAQQNKYLDMTGEYTEIDPAETEEKLNRYLRDNSYSWYDYERCAYFGYSGWATDIIKDYGGRSLDNDTLYEGLARAYSHMATLYLWYQAGGAEVGNDPLMQKLGRLERPGKERIEKVRYYIDLAVQTYSQLEKRNPRYQTRVGNIRMKRINESIYGYNQMMIAGDKVAAKRYIDGAEADAAYVNQAKNYLNSCAPNAILFTFGDNDTYPLWYVQQKLNFRKDVTVINNSLLGLAIYPKILRDNKEVVFSVPDKFLAAANNDYFLYKEDKKAAPTLAAKAFIAAVVAKKNTVPSNDAAGEEIAVPAYTVKQVSFSPAGTAFASLAKQGFAVQPFTITLKGYLFISDLLIFDMIAANINTRPIYFSSIGGEYFDEELISEGIVKRLVPLTATAKKKYTDVEIKNIEQYLSKLYLPIKFKTTRTVDAFASGEEFYHAELFAGLVQYYADKKNLPKAKEWLGKAETFYPGFDEMAGQAASSWGWTHITAGNVEKGTKLLEQRAQLYFDNYQSPSGLYPFISKARCTEMLESMNKYIQESTGAKSTVIKNLLQRLEE